ncbi:RNA polymerase sigma factor [Sphingobacterium sp. SGR-19]|uniref:RNA polymerase sigma factor n=1 Tax=Sphingobacterium sp. SGR-19 TaxID=2710886 RepID=UPI0013EAB45C|nr:sigma-70 family RNA polymerase sigma factor [Sphingobacterium sp. SGR-19]NGM65259.1 sigma-70 family RNA polymerase sigma factor [Sphingobacterium sp. SGR-19]
MNRSRHIYTAYSLDELLQLIRESDSLAFDDLYRRTWKKLYVHAFQKLRDEDLAKDIVQEVFVDFWNKRQLRDIQRVEAYLMRAVKFKVIDRFRKKDFIVEEIEDFAEVLANSEFSDSKLLDDELNTLLNYWISRLPNKRKEIFLLRYEEGLSTEEIGKLLNISTKTVQNQILNATTFLRSLMHKILFLFFLFFFGS